jgi:O-antigen/teichoic acid export membrane protein
MVLKQAAIKGFFWSGVQNWGSQAGSFITFLFLARLLEPSHFGMVALANTFLNFFENFVGQGLDMALVQRKEIDRSHLDTVFWTQVFSGFSFTILGVLFSSKVAHIFFQPDLAPILRCFSVLFPIRSLSLVHRAILRRNLEFQKFAVEAILGIVIGGLVGITLAFKGYGVWSLVGQQFSFELVGLVVFWKLSDWMPGLKFSWSKLKELSKFGNPILLSNLSKFFNRNTDNLFIGYFLGEAALGYYAIAYRVLQVVTQLLVKTASQVLTPFLSKLQHDLGQLRQTFYESIHYTSILSIPVFLGVIFLANELVVTIFGDTWIPSIPIMQVLSIGGIIYLVLIFNQSVFVATGHPHWQLRLDAIGVVINVVTCLVAVRWGLVAVAVAFIFSDAVLIAASVWILTNNVGVSLKTYGSQFLTPAICSSAMVASIVLIRHFLQNQISPFWLLLVSTIVGCAVYLASLRVVSPQIFKQFREAIAALASPDKNLNRPEV